MSRVQSFDFKTAIQKANTEFENAAGAKNASKLASPDAQDARLLPPGSPIISGRSNIQNFWQEFIDAGAADPKIHSVSVETSGEIAYEVGTFDAIMPGSASPSTGKYLVVWKRQPGGDIKIIADMF